MAIAAGTGDVLMSRLRGGRANTARGAAHFLRETVGRVRYSGASGQLTVRADSGFDAHSVVSVCRKMDVHFSITIRQHKSLHNLIEAILERDWTPIPYWIDGAADVAETVYTPFQSEPDAAPVRLIVRRVKPTPGSQLALFATYSYHGFITDRDGETLAHFADAVRPSVRPLRDAETQVLNSLVARRHQMMTMLVSEKNWLGTAISAVPPRIEAHIIWLEQELNDLEEGLRQTLRRSPVWREKDDLLRTVPGVGEQLSLTLRGKRAVWGGRSRVRGTLYMGALTATRWNPVIRCQ